MERGTKEKSKLKFSRGVDFRHSTERCRRKVGFGDFIQGAFQAENVTIEAGRPLCYSMEMNRRAGFEYTGKIRKH